MPDEIVPLLFIGNITDSTNWHGAVIPCLFDVDGFREEVLDGLLERIHRYRGDGVPVLVHCENGIDRSPTVVMHYLVRQLGMSQDEAIKLIKQKRTVANPHPEWQIKKSVKIVRDDYLKQCVSVPEEDRLYLSEIKNPEKLPKDVLVYEGERGGRFVRYSDLKRFGVREEDIGVERPTDETKPVEEVPDWHSEKTEDRMLFVDDILKKVRDEDLRGFKNVKKGRDIIEKILHEYPKFLLKKIKYYLRLVFPNASGWQELTIGEDYRDTVAIFITNPRAIVVSPKMIKELEMSTISSYEEARRKLADVRKWIIANKKKPSDYPERQLPASTIFEGINEVYAVVSGKNRFEFDHEVGHFVYYLLQLENYSEDYNSIVDRVHKIYKSKKEVITEYGETSGEEFFAEHFAFFIRDLKLHKFWFPEMNSLLEELMRYQLKFGESREEWLHERTEQKTALKQQVVSLMIMNTFDPKKGAKVVKLDEDDVSKITQLLSIKKSVKIVEDKLFEKQKHSFLWYDTGLSVDHAINLGKQGHNVYYFVEYRTRFQKLDEYLPGYGFKEIHKILDYGEALDNVETVVFADVGFGALTDLLRKKGYFVFGASVRGEQLELDRIFMLKEFEKLGISVPKYKIVHGVTNLLKAVEGGKKFVKLNIFRGNFETMKVDTPSELKVEIEQSGFGLVAEDIDFIVTDEVDGIEIGCDVLFNGKEFLRPIGEGNETKGFGAQFNRCVDSSEVWDGVLDKLQPWLAKVGYRGNISLEGIFNGSDISILDVTARLFYPGSTVYPAYLENYADVIYAVARGEYVKPRFAKKYYSVISVQRADSKKWTKVNFPAEFAWKNVFLPTGAVYINGEYWCSPGDKLVATITGCGDTFDESIAEIESVANKVHGRDCDVGLAGITRYKNDYLPKMKELGISW